MNDIFISRSVSELQKPEEHVTWVRDDGWEFQGFIDEADGNWWIFPSYPNNDEDDITFSPCEFTHWLEPTTLESLLAEHPEVVEKIMRMAREIVTEFSYMDGHEAYYKYQNAFLLTESLKKINT